ncbi:HIRAN domain-containing protein [Georgenia alba]|uniref:HIRAN domain-containing protein n=1 Tax=Georgenia alba TaxID=2233858 RepID=A0ABW2Q475_9MICO
MTTRTRVKGSAYAVSDAERARYGGREHLLIAEPDNEADPSAVAAYGKGHRVGYLSTARAASLAPLLAQLPGDAFRVTGSSTTSSTIVLWVDVPKVEPLRRFVRSSA